MPKTEAPPAESGGTVVAESPTGRDRAVTVEVDRDAREVVLAVGDTKVRLDAHDLLGLRQLLTQAWLEVA